MKKYLIVILCIFIITPILLAGGCYLAIDYQYKETFMPGIVINGIYASDLSVDEVAEKLSSEEEIPQLVIIEKDGKEHKIDLSEIGYAAEYKDEIQKKKELQNVVSFLNWFVDEQSQTREYTVAPQYRYDEELLDSLLEEAEYLKDNSDPKGKTVEVRYATSKGYYLYDETQALLSHEKAVKAIKSAIKDRDFTVDLEKQDCYVKAEYTKDMQEALDLWEQLKPYMDTVICYEFGKQKVAIDGKKISGFLAKDENGELTFDEDGNIYVDEKNLKEFVHQFAEENNTVKKPRQFRATRGDIVTVNSTTYGIKIDEKAEYEFLLSSIKSGRTQKRVPELSVTNFTNIYGLDDIGDTYIEVDMTNQHMYYYVNGRVKLSTDVVTGCTALGRGTPEMVCYVYAKQRNRVLRGPGYESFVNFWIPVNKGIGIHDASWRSSYGGEIYKRGGSHGCVNTPYDKVSQLYDMVEIGTPVIIFY